MLTDRALGIPKHHYHKTSSSRPQYEFLGNRRICVLSLHVVTFALGVKVKVKFSLEQATKAQGGIEE
jgi:hypothetical protein